MQRGLVLVAFRVKLWNYELRGLRSALRSPGSIASSGPIFWASNVRYQSSLRSDRASEIPIGPLELAIVAIELMPFAPGWGSTPVRFTSISWMSRELKLAHSQQLPNSSINS